MGREEIRGLTHAFQAVTRKSLTWGEKRKGAQPMFFRLIARNHLHGMRRNIRLAPCISGREMNRA